MKKLLVLVLSLALLCAMSVPAFAATPITSVGGSDSASVKGTYVSGSGSLTVYSVDIAWGSMEFTYTDASQGNWNPLTHEYDGAVEATWTCADGANRITVTNHSNASVTATLSYAAATGYDAISGAFSAGELVLDSAVGTAFAAAPAKSSLLTLSGALPKTATNVTIGTVTVTLGN